MHARTKKEGRDTLSDKQIALAKRIAGRIRAVTPAGVAGGDFEWHVTLDGLRAELAGNGAGAVTLLEWSGGRKRMGLTRSGKRVRVVLCFSGSSVSTLPKVAAAVATYLS